MAVAAARTSRNLIRLSTTSRFFTFRNQSINRIINPIEEGDQLDSEFDHVLELKRIESAMQEILVRKCTPGWLPFVPGGSYWVPTVGSGKSNNVAEMVEKLASLVQKEQRNAQREVRTESGWPSQAYFFKGASPHSIEMEIQSNNKSEDEE